MQSSSTESLVPAVFISVRGAPNKVASAPTRLAPPEGVVAAPAVGARSIASRAPASLGAPPPILVATKSGPKQVPDGSTELATPKAPTRGGDADRAVGSLPVAHLETPPLVYPAATPNRQNATPEVHPTSSSHTLNFPLPKGPLGPATPSSKGTVVPRVTKPQAPSPEETPIELPRARIESVDSGFAFPLEFVPKAGWHKGDGARWFGASRGYRKHAGCDLLAPVGSQIYAVADGVLAIGQRFFYSSKKKKRPVWAVVLQHGSFLVRYGEIVPHSYIGGKTVKKGQPIAKVGQMDDSSMIHFEMYRDGSNWSNLWDDYSPFRRRKDLMDPTQYLDEWAKQPLPRPGQTQAEAPALDDSQEVKKP
ncbi:MAG: peptidoglycan DD-metalloendopeptidase family protein [Polyangiaceae bacterium]